MSKLMLFVPTYNGDVTDSTIRDALPGFGYPCVPVVIRKEGGARVVLGSSEYLDMNAPDVLIERHPQGWAIVLHPFGGGDPSGAVYFLDDGRSFVVAAEECENPVRVVDSIDEFPEFDTLPKEARAYDSIQ